MKITKEQVILNTELFNKYFKNKRLNKYFRKDIHLSIILAIAYQNICRNKSYNDLAKQYKLTPSRIGQIVRYYLSSVEPIIKDLERR